MNDLETREKLANIYAGINNCFPSYIGATATSTTQGHTLIQIRKSTVCLKRFKSLI